MVSNQLQLLNEIQKLKKTKTTTLSGVNDWLRKQDTYTLHKLVRKRFTRNRLIVLGPNELRGWDLNDMRGLSAYNDNVNFSLTAIDVCSKRLFVKPLKKKICTEVVEAFRQLFENEAKRTTRCLQTDISMELTGSAERRLFKEYKIRSITTQNPDVKGVGVERVH